MRTAALTALLMVSFVSAAPCQGLSGAAIEGSVTGPDGVAVPDASVSLRDSASGHVRRTTTDRGGRFRFENAPAGTYRIEVRAIGASVNTHDGLRLQLGDRARLNLVLSRAAQPLAELVVREAQQRDAGSGGAAYAIPREAIHEIPLLDRDFVGLLAFAPQAVGPASLYLGGQHSRYNAIQVDGVAANDFMGINITPGASAGARAIPLEAIREVRTLIAPFDVRHGGFSGGLINAITRSGSNNFRSTVFTALTRSSLVGRDSTGSEVPGFEQLQYGLVVGGPIRRDRLHFLGVAEIQSRRAEFVGPSADDPATGVSVATAARAIAAFRDRFGFDPGDATTPDLEEPTGNAMLKISWQPSVNQHVEITPFLSWARSEALNRTVRNLQNSDGWQLSRSTHELRNQSRGVRIRAVSAFGRVSNEAIASYSAVTDEVDSRLDVPLFLVQADAVNTYLSGGSVKSAQGTVTAQRLIELTDNVSIESGDHVLTVGSQNWIVRVHDSILPGAWGVWTFANIDSLESGSPSRYEIAVPLREQPLSSYWSLIGSVYMQDQWRATDRLRLTAGVRLEAPLFQPPTANASLAAISELGGIDTGRFPSGNLVAAPRIGFNWVATGNGRTMIRGGAGMFTGRPPLVWLTNAFASTGEDQSLIVCTRAEGVPAPVADIRNLPRGCTGGAARNQGRPTVSYFDRDFRFQQAVKYSIGIDHALPGRWTLSGDLSYTVTRNHVTLRDVNLVRRGESSEGRSMYGSILPSGESRPTRLDSASFGPIYEFANASRDRSEAATLVVRRNWRSGGLVQAGYHWSRTRDAMSMLGFSGTVIFRNNTIDGSLENRRTTRSNRDIPHNFTAVAILPAGRGFTASLVARARSGAPYGFTVNGDANADGAPRNDLAYIPAGPNDIELADPTAYARLDSLIESVPCLRSQRGSIMRRNSCRNPAVSTIDARVTKKFGVRRMRAIELSADVFNVANLLNRRWGLVRETTPREDMPLMAMVGWNSPAGRPRYAITQLPKVDQVVPDVSRWRAQLGARYEF